MVVTSSRSVRTHLWIVLLVTLCATAQTAWASDALAKKHACVACHQIDRKLVGPPWKDIAAKYADGSVTPDQLAATLKKGSSGKWGSMPMPPQPQVPDADLQQLAVWALGGGK
jgi:cytochrome c